MKIVCINKVYGLTVGKEYDVIDIGPNPNGRHPWVMGYFVNNDYNLVERYERSPMGIIEVIELTDIFLEYIGPEHSGLTIGKTYQILEDKCGYYYFLDDKNKFVGISKTGYFGGESMFRNRIKERVNKISKLI